MGFGSFVKRLTKKAVPAVIGGVTGFLTGGPAGAVAGAGSALFGGGSNLVAGPGQAPGTGTGGGFFDRYGNLIGAGLGAVGSYLDYKGDREAASAARDISLLPFSATGPGGITAGYTVQNGQVVPTYGLGDLDPIRSAFVNFAQQQAGQLGSNVLGGVPDAEAALNAARGALPASFADPLANLSGYAQGAAGQAYGGLSTVAPDQILSILRQQAQPYENQALNRLQDRLFAQGRLGTTGGSRNFQAFAKGLGEADLSRQVQAQTLSDQLANSAFGRFGQTLGLAADLNQAEFGRGFDLNNLQYQRALEGLGTAQQSAQFGNQLTGQRFNLINQALAGQAGLQDQGLQNFQNALQASIARSNASAGVAGNLTNLAGGTNPFVQLGTGILSAVNRGG